MKIGKLITFNILAFLTSLNIFYIYFGQGMQQASFSKGYLLSMINPFVTILVLFLMTLFVNLSFIVLKAKNRKNLLRISLLFIVILTIISIIVRGIELFRGTLCGICLLNTLLYIVLLVINVLILKDLYKLVRELTQ